MFLICVQSSPLTSTRPRLTGVPIPLPTEAWSLNPEWVLMGWSLCGCPLVAGLVPIAQGTSAWGEGWSWSPQQRVLSHLPQPYGR